MALDTFVPPARFASGPTTDISPRVNAAQFGDGYSQRSGDGLNAETNSFTGQFPTLTLDQEASLLAFFTAHSVTPFLWALPMDSLQRKWTATKWTRGIPFINRRSLSFTFTEVFDL